MAGLSACAQALAAGGQADAWSIADEALRRTAAGEQLTLLTLGDPHGPPHPAIVAAATAALEAGRTHYSPLLGEPALRAAVAAHEGASPAHIAIVPGAQHAAFAAIALLAGVGDDVILSDPCYASYPGVVAASGAAMVCAPVRPDLSFDVAAIAAAVTPRTRVIFLNSPANPTGAALSAADYQALAALCEARDLWLVVDEVYGLFRFDGAPVRAWQHGPHDRTIVLNSLSKSHRMTGFRIGWVVAPEAVIAAMADWSAAALFGVSQFVQDAAMAALALPPAEHAAYHHGFAARARQVAGDLAAIAGIQARMPDGGMFVMADVRGLLADDIAFARRLLDVEGVAVMPGSAFGPAGAGHIRISLCPEAAVLAAATARIADFAERLRHDRLPG